MKFLPRFLFLVILLAITQKGIAQNDLREESIYFLMTTRFFDGDTSNSRPTEWCSWFEGNPNNNNYSGREDVTWRGDFKGLVQQLDYIKDMGFTAIWITPVVQNRSPLDYHGYHAWDFTKVDPRLESPGYTFKNLIDSVHAKGMKIILDVVLNHAGRYGIKNKAEIKYNTDPNQPWGKNKNGMPLTDNPNWTYDGIQANPDDNKIWSRANLAKLPPPYNQNLSAYNWPSTESYINTTDALWYNKSGNGFAQGYDDTTNLYYRALAGDTPDLLTSGDSVRNYLFQAYKTFIEWGIDGMRLDAIKHMPKRDVLYFIDKFKEVNPNLMFFGEVAQKRHELHQIDEINPHYYTWRGATQQSAPSGLAVLDFYAMGTFHLFGKGEAFANVKAAARYDHLYADAGYNVMFLDNHDFGPNNDWNKRYDGTAENLAAALNFMFTWRGLPCVYYGTETQFMKGAFADIQSSNDIQYSINRTGRAYYGNNIASAHQHQIYKHIKKLNAIRKAIPALQKGTYRWDGTNSGNGVGFVRKHQSSEVAVGLAKDGAVTFNFTNLTNGIYRDAITGNEIIVTNGTLSFTVSPSSAGIYVLNGIGLIGALGEGFFQSSSTGGGTTASVIYNPVNPNPGKNVTITYQGFLKTSTQVYMHYSFDNWTKGGIKDIAMTRSGNDWITTVAIPAEASINFCAAFHNGSGTWDNNGSADYKTNLSNQVDNTPPLIISYFPSVGSLNNSTTTPVDFTCNENIRKGSGNIFIYEEGILIHTIDVQSNQTQINNSRLSINNISFKANQSYHILFDEGIVTDLSNNKIKALNTSTEWRFETGNSAGIGLVEENPIIIHPNPVAAGKALQININEMNPYEIKWYDVTGSELKNLVLDNLQNLTAPGKAGIYYLEIKSDTKFKRIKILVTP